MELTNNMRKLICSLSLPKGRREHGLFVTEGVKAIGETLPFFRLHSLWCTPSWREKNPGMFQEYEINIVSQKDFDRISAMKTPQGVLAVYYLPESAVWNPSAAEKNLVLALDGIQDPGNIGTIIRVADWFGIDTVLASRNTADCFSPKVIQATMGAIGRVSVVYTDLPDVLKTLKNDIPVYGTFLDGENIYETGLTPDRGVIVMGNEGNGISPEVAACVTHRILIPHFPHKSKNGVVESLNVGVATAVAVSVFRQSIMKNVK